jgi:hypothetical protein
MLLIDMKPQNYLPLPAPINVAGDGLVPAITFSTSPTSTGQPCGWVKLGMPRGAPRNLMKMSFKSQNKRLGSQKKKWMVNPKRRPLNIDRSSLQKSYKTASKHFGRACEVQRGKAHKVEGRLSETTGHPRFFSSKSDFCVHPVSYEPGVA